MVTEEAMSCSPVAALTQDHCPHTVYQQKAEVPRSPTLTAFNIHCGTVGPQGKLGDGN